MKMKRTYPSLSHIFVLFKFWTGSKDACSWQGEHLAALLSLPTQVLKWHADALIGLPSHMLNQRPWPGVY